MKALTTKAAKRLHAVLALKPNQNVMEDDNVEEMIAKAKNQRRQKLFDQRVALLKAEDAFKQLGGEDDYELSLLTIVMAYPNGITLTRVRELLPDSKRLDAAKETLKTKGLIGVGDDKRSPLLTPKPVKRETAQPPQPETTPAEANPTSDHKPEAVPPVETQKLAAAK